MLHVSFLGLTTEGGPLSILRVDRVLDMLPKRYNDITLVISLGDILETN